MRTLLLAALPLLLVPLPGQSPIADTMRALADATNGLRAAVAKRDRATIGEHLDAVDATVADLRAACDALPHPTAAAAAVDALAAAAAAMRRPIGDGAASDAWDLSRLRGACTACHVHNRDENAVRGLFPNRGAAVGGRLALVDRDGAELEDRSGVVVFLEHPDDAPAPQPRPPVISQRGRRFDPPVLVVTAGTTVRFPNDDIVFHNVFSLSRGNAFDLGTYGKGTERERPFASPGLIKVHCNIHADMASHVLVLNSPRHAVTAADGTWCIPDVPGGRYTLRVWHSLADEQRRVIDVDGAGVVDVAIDLRESKVRAPHPNKHGRRYRKKY